MNATLSDYPIKFLLILYGNELRDREVIKRVQTKSKNKFTRKLKLIPAESYAFLRVSYVDGGWNDGFYKNKTDLMLAYLAFTEK